MDTKLFALNPASLILSGYIPLPISENTTRLFCLRAEQSIRTKKKTKQKYEKKLFAHSDYWLLFNDFALRCFCSIIDRPKSRTNKFSGLKFFSGEFFFWCVTHERLMIWHWIGSVCFVLAKLRICLINECVFVFKHFDDFDRHTSPRRHPRSSVHWADRVP